MDRLPARLGAVLEVDGVAWGLRTSWRPHRFGIGSAQHPAYIDAESPCLHHHAEGCDSRGHAQDSRHAPLE